MINVSKIREMEDLFVCKLATCDDFLLTMISSPAKKLELLS